MKLDFKNVALSTGAGLAVTGLGYLIWRHEQLIQAQQAAQQQAAQQQTADYTVQALQQEVQQMQQSMAYTGYGSSYGSTYGADYSQVSGTTLQSVPQDSNLAAILSAFLGTQQSGTSSTSSTSPTGASDSNTTTAVTPSTTQQVASSGAVVSGIGQIPSSLLTPTTVSAVTGINQQQASNPIVTSSVGAASGVSSSAVSASHTLATTTGQS